MPQAPAPTKARNASGMALPRQARLMLFSIEEPLQSTDMIIQETGSLAPWYGAARTAAFAQAANAGTAAGTAGKISISEAARARLAAETRSSTTPGGGSLVRYDTDKGPVALDIDEYFSGRPRAPGEELPPLLMPSQQNIDALQQHLSEVFPKFLSEHGIPSAPENITFDNQGQPRFPADYPYADQLSRALKESPALSGEITAAHALTSAKTALDEAVRRMQHEAQPTGASQSLFTTLIADKQDQQDQQEVFLHFSPAGRLNIASGK